MTGSLPHSPPALLRSEMSQRKNKAKPTASAWRDPRSILCKPRCFWVIQAQWCSDVSSVQRTRWPTSPSTLSRWAEQLSRARQRLACVLCWPPPARCSAYNRGPFLLVKSGGLRFLLPPKPDILLDPLTCVSSLHGEQGEDLGEASEGLKFSFSKC